MQVHILRSVIGPDGAALDAGSEHDLPDAFAASLLFRGAARRVTPAPDGDAPALTVQSRDPKVRRTR